MKKTWRAIKIGFLILSVIAIFLAAWAFWYEPDSLVVRNYEIKIAGWNPAHDNFKIVAISDVHGGSNFITDAKLKKVVELANRQNADLIVLLGDFVSQRHDDRSQLKMPVATIADNLAGLRARHGVYAVIGNHDWWFSTTGVRRELERVGYRVLDNEATTIEANGAKLRLLGLKDALLAGEWRKYSDEAKNALAKTENAGKIIAITHSPDVLPLTTGELSISPDFALMLAGHTHGGQVRFPFFGSLVVPSEYGQKYALGHIEENGVHLFVTTGVGTSILPVRFGVPPEISVLTISAKN